MSMTTLLDTRTMTDRTVAASADRVHHLARSTSHPFHASDDLVVAWQGERGFYTNLAYLLTPPADWDLTLATIDSVVPSGRPVSLVSPSPVPDLSGRGWQFLGHPPLMVRPAGGAPTPGPAELTITEVDDEVGLEVFERTLVDAYPDPAMQPYRFGSFQGAGMFGGATRLFVGTVAGRPVATSAVHVHAGVNLVEFISTMPDARGRGYGEALTWRATLADPSLPSTLIASDLGRPVYERLGFTAVSRWSFWYRPS